MTDETTTDVDGEVVEEWVVTESLDYRERYRIVKEQGTKVLYKRRERNEGGEWVVEPFPRSSVWDGVDEEEMPSHAREGWEDVPAEFEEVNEDAEW